VYVEIALVAYLIDRTFGEFGFIRHPVILMGDYIAWFEKHFYQDSVMRGALLSFTLLLLTGIISYTIQYFLISQESLITILVSGLIASTTIASKMLYESVREVTTHPEKIRYLVSRDTRALTPSQINKAAIETYAENLSDGVIAPLFYLLLFGLPGAFVYKAVNTLDSMVGYRNQRYEKFGKASARLDDIANYIPARITAVLIILLHGTFRAGTRPTPTPNKSVAKQRIPASFIIHYSSFIKVFKNAPHHPSPNAGYPICAMAYALDIRLGGPTSYFGRVVPKAWFGEGREEISTEDIHRALKLQPRLDIVIVMILGIGAVL
jgi:adenosylcobinamide-phosphate synthase